MFVTNFCLVKLQPPYYEGSRIFGVPEREMLEIFKPEKERDKRGMRRPSVSREASSVTVSTRGRSYHVLQQVRVRKTTNME
jgi:hypothetical protein